MALEETKKRLTMETVSSGVEKAASDINKVADAEARLAVVSKESERAQLSLDNAFARLERRYVEGIRQQQELEKVQRQLNAAVAQNPTLQERANRVLEAASAKYQEQIASIQKLIQAQASLNSAQSVNQRLAVRDDFGTAGRAADIQAYGKALDDVRAKFNPLFAATRTYKETQDEINRAVKTGALTQKEGSAALGVARNEFVRHTEEVRKGQQSLANTTKLSRYELINLSRQVQDVGVSLASGQSPFTVLIQQGTQIADVFAASQGTVRGFFSSALGWAGRFALSTGGVVTAVTAIGASALWAASSWSSGQREIDRALTGIGRASGATRDQINSIAKASASTTAASVGEAREAATIFAGTGKIYAENIQVATDLTKDFARATGTDMTAAAKTMAEALADPTKGALELNKTLGFLDGKTLQYIQTLQNQNRLQEAQRVLMDAARSSIQEQANTVGGLSALWDSATKAISQYWEIYKKATARTGERLTGADLGGFSSDERLTRQRERVTGAETALAQPGLGLGERSAAIEAVNREREALRKLEEQAGKTATAVADARFRDFSLQADAAVKSLIPQIQQLERLEAKLADIKRAREGVPAVESPIGEPSIPGVSAQQVRGRMGASDQDLQRASEAARLLKQIISETADQTARANSEALRLAEAYGDVSLEVAKTLEQQQRTLSVSEAVTGAQKIAAQEAATYNQLIDEGRTHQEATAIAAGQTANALAQVNSQAQLALQALRDQEAVAGAVTAQERMAAQEAATLADLLRQGVDASTAMATAFQQTAIAQAQINANAQQTIASLTDQLGIAQAVGEQEKSRAKYAADYNAEVRKGVDGPLADRIASLKQETEETQRAAQAEQERQRQFAALQQSLGLAANNASNIRLFMGDAEAAAFDAAAGAEKFRRAMEGAALAAEQAAQNTREAAASAAAAADDAAKRTLVGTKGTFELGPGPGQFAEKKYAEERGAQAEFELLRSTMTRALFQVNITETAESIRKAINDVLGRGGTLDEALNLLESPYGPLSGKIPQDLKFDTMLDLMRRQTESSGDTAREILLLKQQIVKVQEMPRSLEQMDLLKTLNDRLKELQEATEDLTDTIKIGLDPIYTQGHDALKIGYYDERGGGMRTGTGWTSPFMSQQQSMPSDAIRAVGGTGVGPPPGMQSGTFSFGRFATGGLVTSPTLALIGEKGPEMVIPVGAFQTAASGGGAIQTANDNARAPRQMIVINNFPPGSLFGDRRTRRQSGEGYGRSMASVRS